MSVREGYSFRRLDGSTEPQERLRIVDEYNTTDSIFLFLISTKARFSSASLISLAQLSFSSA